MSAIGALPRAESARALADAMERLIGDTCRSHVAYGGLRYIPLYTRTCKPRFPAMQLSCRDARHYRPSRRICQERRTRERRGGQRRADEAQLFRSVFYISMRY